MYDWEVQGFYTDEWECLTTEETKEAALEQARVYDENEPGIPHRIRPTRIDYMQGQGQTWAVYRHAQEIRDTHRRACGACWDAGSEGCAAFKHLDADMLQARDRWIEEKS